LISRFKTLGTLAAMLVIAALVAACGNQASAGDSSSGTVVVSSKDYNEGFVLGELLAQIIERQTDLKVERKINLGGTMVNWEALKKGEVDIYPDYTGTGLMAILKRDVMKDPKEVYDLVQKEYNEQFKVKWLEPFGFNNTYATAVSKELAAKHNLKTNSDLQKIAPQLVFGGEHEFFNRKDGYPGWIETYGLKFKDAKRMDASLKYEAIGQGEVDVIDAFSTDGELVTYGLTILEDDKQFFPPYDGVAVARMDTLEKYPQLEKAVNLLAGKIDDETMQQLNYKTKEQGQDVEKVVTEFLDELGL
jgi:osmoprotectant transport system substrate-binding protein